MRLLLFAKVFLLACVAALLAYALTPIGLTGLLKGIALGLAVSIALAVFYPELRGVQNGDRVVVTAHPLLPFFVGRMGKALSRGTKNAEIRIKLENGEEAVGILESYDGLISPPRVRLLYEEKLVE